MRRVSLFCAVGIALAILGLCVPVAQATTYTYTALATDYGGTWGVWSNPNNWDTWPGNGGNAYTDTYSIAVDNVDGYPTNQLTIDSANPKGSWQWVNTGLLLYPYAFAVYASGGHYLDTTGGTININGGGGQLTMQLPIQGTGSVSINGSVNFSTTDTNSYSGSTIVNAGASLTAPNYYSLPGYNVSGMVDVKGGATLSIGGGWSAGQMSDLLTYANWESGSSFGVNTSGGDVTTSASFTGLNLTKSGANTLYLVGGTVTNGSLAVSGGTLNASDPIVGTASIIVYGGATAILSGNNNYSGGTTVGGALTAVNRAALPNWNVQSKLSVSGALILGVGDEAAGYFDATDVDTVLTNGIATIGFDTTGAPSGFSYSGALAGHAVIKQGPNTLDLYNSLNSAVTVTGGTMNVHNDVVFANGTSVNVTGGALNFMGNNVGSPSYYINVGTGGTLTLGGSNYGDVIATGGCLNLNNNAAAISNGTYPSMQIQWSTLGNTSGTPVTLSANPVIRVDIGATSLGVNSPNFGFTGNADLNLGTNQFQIWNGYSSAYPSHAPIVTLNIADHNLTVGKFSYGMGETPGDQLVKAGSGTLTLSNANDGYYFWTDSEIYFKTVVSAGTLQLDDSTFNASTGQSSGCFNIVLPGDPYGATHAGASVQGGRLVFDYAGGGDPYSTILGLIGTQLTTSAGYNPLVVLDNTRTDQVLVANAITGDANLDGTVNGQDLNTVLSNFNKTGMSWAQGDFYGSGTVNGSDLNTVLSNFNQSVSAIGAVPEPSTLLLLAAGLAGLLAHAWRKRK